MTSRKPNKLRSFQRQRLTRRVIITTGLSVLILSAGIFSYLQFSQTEESKAGIVKDQTQEVLSVEFKVDEIKSIQVDTNMQNGNRFKVARPLSLTPTTGY